MAVTSGRVNSTVKKHSSFYVEWQQTGQDTSGNYTDINWQAGLNCGTSPWDSWYSNAVKIYSVIINGETVYDSHTFSNISGRGDHQLASGSKRIYHNDNGSKTFNITINGWLYSYGDTSGSDNFELTSIPRYVNISNFSVSRRDETSVVFSYTVDANCDWAWYSTDNGGSWHNLDVSNIVSGLSANTGYNFKLKVRRTDSQLTSETGAYYQTTYDYPKPTSLNDFTIGNGATVHLDNPLNRNVTLELISNNDGSTIGTYTGTYNGDINAEFKTSDAIDKQYKSIPNSNSGTYYAKVTYGSVVKTLGTKTYYTNTANCSPSFSNFNVKDSNTDIVNVTGNDQLFVKGYSKLYITIPSNNKMTTQKYATPNKYVISCDTLNTEVNYSSSDINTEVGTIANSGTLRANVRAYDSRNNSALAYKDITVLDYAKPVINVSATRLNNFENETTVKVSGTYTKLTINNTDKNTITNVKYRYRETGGTWSNWTNISTTVSNGTFTCSDVILSLDNTKSFEFEIQATDNIDNNTVTTNVDIGQAIFFISSNNRACYINGQEILQYDVVDTW